MKVVFYFVIIFIVAFAVTYLTVPISKRIALHLDAIDYPGNRRVNRIPVPRCGGIALYCGFLSAFLLALFFVYVLDADIPGTILAKDINFVILLCGITLMFAVGLVDDIHEISPKKKLLLQIIACFVVYLSGVSITVIKSPLTNEFISLGVLDGPLTVFYLLIFVNITNLIDGLDGLAAGLVAIASFFLLTLIIPKNSFLVCAMCCGLIGICLAFLRYNFHPATIFMGDSGSLLLGLIVGSVSIMGVVRMASVVSMLVPFVIAGVPVVDTATSIIRRLLSHKRIDEADAGHLHHRLLDIGFSQRRAVLILYACAVVLGMIGITLRHMYALDRYIILVVLALVLSIVVWKLGLCKPVLQHYYDHAEQAEAGAHTAASVPSDDEACKDKRP